MASHPFGNLTPFLLNGYYKRRGPFHPLNVKVVSTKHKTVLLPSYSAQPMLYFADRPKFYVSAKPKAAGSSTSSANDYTVSWNQQLLPTDGSDQGDRNLLQWGLGYRVIFEVSQQKKKQKDPRKDTESYPNISLQVLDRPDGSGGEPTLLAEPQKLRMFWKEFLKGEEYTNSEPVKKLVVEITPEHIQATKNGKVVFHTGHFLRTLDLEKPEFKAWSKPKDGCNPVFTNSQYFSVKQVCNSEKFSEPAWEMFRIQVEWLFTGLLKNCEEMQSDRRSKLAKLAMTVLEALDFWFIQPAKYSLSLGPNPSKQLKFNLNLLETNLQCLQTEIQFASLGISSQDPPQTILTSLHHWFNMIDRHIFRSNTMQEMVTLREHQQPTDPQKICFFPVGVSWLQF